MTTPSPSQVPGPALCVDLDGTLVRTDLLYESLLALLATNPLYVFLLPLWLLRGKAALKHEIARRVELDVTTLPYDARVLEALRTTAARPRVLCTASNERLARAVADHVGVFDLVIASDPATNLAGHEKGHRLVERFGERGFDYAGNSSVDLHIWRRARQAWVVNGSAGLAGQASNHCPVEHHLPAEGGGFRTWLKAMRLHQWLKNLLVFVPLLASHRVLEVSAATASALAFVAFGMCASGVYVLNDLLDLPSDRRHPRKCRRPFAAGNLSLMHGLMVAPLLTLLGFAIAFAVSPWFFAALFGYYSMTLAYSLRLKRVVMVDVVLLAALYTVRIIGGALAISTVLSFWLLAFSMFIFLSLAMLKRYTELIAMRAAGREEASGRGYRVDDISLIQSLGCASGYAGVLVFALYINSPESLALYDHPEALWLLSPLLLYWISRVWLIAHRGLMHDDPVIFAVTDRVSQAVLLLCGLIVAGAL